MVFTRREHAERTRTTAEELSRGGWLPAGHREWTVALPASPPLPILDQSDGG